MRVVLAYFVTGFGLLFLLQTIYAQRFGGDFSVLLHVEETSLLRPFIEKHAPSSSTGGCGSTQPRT